MSNAWCRAIALPVLVLAISAFADLIKAPPTIPDLKGSVAVTDTNKKPRWTADWTMQPWKDNGRAAVRFTETGHGRYSPFTSDVNWKLEAIWSASDAFLPLHFDRTFTDTKGTVIATEKKDFDRASSTVRYERHNPMGRPQIKTLTVPPDTITVEGIAGVLRYFPFEPNRLFTTHLLSNEPRLYDLTIESRGREHVRTPAGEFDCYKIELVPHLGVLNLFKGFFPRTYFWFTVAPPHFWVRYEGFENGVGTPQIVMELKGTN